MKRQMLFLGLCALAISAMAQGTVDDYRRAYNLRSKYGNKVVNANVQSRFLSGDEFGNKMWYSVTENGGQKYYLVDLKTNKHEVIFDNDKVASAMSSQLGSEVKGNQLWINPELVKLNDGNVGVKFAAKGYNWTYDAQKNELTKGEEMKGDRDGDWRRGPRGERPWSEVDDQRGRTADFGDGKIQVYGKDNNLYIKNKDTKEESALTTDGNEHFYYSSWGSFSSDGKYYATVKIKPAPKRYVTYVNSSPSDQLQPKYFNIEYAKPGDSLDYKVPVVIELATKKVIVPSDELFASQFDLSTPRWDEGKHTLTFEFNERGHKTYRVLELNAETGKVRPIIEEKENKYIAWTRLSRNDLSDGKHIIWFSERDRYGHLYMYDRTTGKVVNQITKGKFYVRQILNIDEDNKVIYFTASGEGLPKTNPNEDPYNIHYCKVNFNGKGFVDLTPEEGNHRATFNEDRTYLVDTYSTVENPPVTVLRNGKTGKIVRTLAKADISELKKTDWQPQEVFVAKGRDGKTDMWGIIQRPSNFDPNKKYPVIEYIYSGPGDQYVPKNFSAVGSLSDLAELGFIVVQLDAMTTSWRSKDFEEVCYKNLKDAGFPDRIAWIKAAAEKYPYMDLDRVGIYGCSAGGQEALAALLFHGDFYKAAYSACGCHDNRMDKIWWNEQWMGYPIDESYVASSNTENIDKLKGKLMLVVGELDDNVDPSSSFQVVNQLIKHNKDFEFIYLPGEHHTMGGAYGTHKMYDFFVKNFLGVEPPAWSELEK